MIELWEHEGVQSNDVDGITRRQLKHTTPAQIPHTHHDSIMSATYVSTSTSKHYPAAEPKH